MLIFQVALQMRMLLLLTHAVTWAHAAGLCQTCLTLHGSLWAYQTCFWYRYNFTVRQQEVEQLKALTVEQIKDFYQAHIPHAATGRRRLTVHVLSSSHQGGTPQGMIEDLDKFKAGLKECALPALLKPVS